MSRPTYETAATLGCEAKFAEVVAQYFQTQLRKLPKSYYVDFAAHFRGELRAWFELKCRQYPQNKFPELILSLNKWKHGIELSTFTGKPFFIAVQWLDAAGYLPVEEQNYRIAFAGRLDRNDPEDFEPCVWIPVQDFKPIPLPAGDAPCPTS